MYNRSINIDAAVEHTKNIVDNNRCVICDKTHGTCMRYACGHTSCEDCVVVAAHCSVCSTPRKSESNGTVADRPKTQITENAVNLQNISENEFDIDVYKRQRLSEQLKVEKELFPTCIQAPVKYYNKRKSYKNTNHNKENKLSQLPGEDISSAWDNKMNQSKGNVEKWLNKYVRKPFADLNKNDDRLNSPFIKRQKEVKGTENAPIMVSNRKRSHVKTALSGIKNQPHVDINLTPVKKKVYHKKPKIESSLSVNSDTSNYFKKDSNLKATSKGESGIVIDDEAVIVIDDSQSIRVDKDMNPWLAVQEVESKNQHSLASTISSKTSNMLPQNIEKVVEETELNMKVPFYLKGYLSAKCFDCNKSLNNDNEHSKLEPITNDVSITVESKSFTAVINVKTVENTEKKIKSMQSVEIQTDKTVQVINDEPDLDHDNNLVKQISLVVCQSPVQDLLKCDEKIHDDQNLNNIVRKEMNLKSINRSENVIIEESDSDEDVEASVSLQVTADIHRSCEEIDYGVLSDVDNLAEHSKRARRAPRGITPTSTDSSEKENYNPNRKKKATSSKKKPMKK